MNSGSGIPIRAHGTSIQKGNTPSQFFGRCQCYATNRLDFCGVSSSVSRCRTFDGVFVEAIRHDAGLTRRPADDGICSSATFSLGSTGRPFIGSRTTVRRSGKRRSSAEHSHAALSTGSSRFWPIASTTKCQTRRPSILPAACNASKIEDLHHPHGMSTMTQRHNGSISLSGR